MVNPIKQKHKPNSIRSLLSFYLKTAGKDRKLIPLQLLLYFLDGCMRASLPLVMGYVVDQLIQDAANFVQNQLAQLAVGLVVISFLFYGNVVLLHYLAQKICYRVGRRFQINLYHHLQYLSADFYQRTRIGEITSRLTNDIDQGVTPIYRRVADIFWAASVFVPSCISMLYLSVELFGVFLLTVLVFVLLSILILPKVRQLNRGVRDEYGRVNARITEDISAHSLIRNFSRESLFIEKIQAHTTLLLSKALRTAKVSFLFTDIINTFISIVGPLALLLAGSYFVGANTTAKISIGTLVSAYGYWLAVSRPISQVLFNITELFSSFASMDRIMDFFKERPRVKDPVPAKGLRVNKGEIEIDSVSFSYPLSDKNRVLENLSLTIEPQKSLALVGESGAGKSTIVQLIMRIYDPLSGSIRIDGQDIRQITQHSLRRQIGIVMQDTILLSGSVRENMLFAKPEADEVEITNALKSAEAWEFISAMPDKMDTLLGERGVRLSGGQRQRIAIARVFLKNPPIVIFDEATSSLDSIREKQIQASMEKLFQDRTSFIIAHRLSTIANCDQIAVLQNKRVTAMGKHADLLQKSKRYREMLEKQAAAQKV